MQNFAEHVNYLPSKLPPGAYQTYEATAPLETHWRPATCAEVECKAFMQGWTHDAPPGSPGEFRIRQVYDAEIRRGAVTTTKLENGFLRFNFPAGTACFRRVWHKLPLERPALFTVRSGDWRGTDGVIREFSKPEDWVDHFATHQENISKLADRG